MDGVIVIGVAGGKDLYVADLDAGTIKPITPPTTGALQTVVDLRSAGASVIKGVDVAISVTSAEDAAHGRFDG
ncbi:hypothetical protein [Sinorhizobium meliloti]|uniref:hypothetical protein n=1 Tax=Rhizobium meliloti TaxID=382 RepID=UPI00209030DE|nr:hypothetical protein [Sinorhizobium meliloti]MCO5963692.1 hypothetical protein [Sinorhizobium meliloti]